MASLSYFSCYSYKRDNGITWSMSRVVSSINVNGTSSQILHLGKKQNIDTAHRLGIFINDVEFRQTNTIRSTEVAPNKIATIESILSLFQEAKVNQMRMTGLNIDGFATTPEMIRNNLIWAVSKIQVEVEHYPMWGDIVDTDTWFGETTRNGVRRDWQLRCHTTGLLLAKATSTWIMMNRNTRNFARMPETVRAELSPWLVNKRAIDSRYEKIEKLDIDKAICLVSNIKPKRTDLDMNNHVNNVKYLGWMFETIPEQFSEAHQLSRVELEYKKECRISDVVQSLCAVPQFENGIPPEQFNKGKVITYIHQLHINGETHNEEITRGRTTWKRNLCAPCTLT